jgi:hypothetical protein
MSPFHRMTLALVAFTSGILTGCNDKPAPPPAPSASAAATPASAAPSASSAAVAVPLSRAEVERTLNPRGEKPYDGETGTLKGRITIKGDPPPATDHRYSADCAAAKDVYGSLFRVGADGALPDVLVAVTGYEGFVPEREETETVTLEQCKFDKNTVALTFGQRIDVKNADEKRSYMPYLDGAPFRAVMVAVPKGDAVKLYPQKEGRYLLRDQMKRPYLISNVFVLKFPTHGVTDGEGRYEISGIPVGKVKVNALLPAVRKAAEKEIEIAAGDNALDLVIEYDAEKDVPPPIPAPVWGDREAPK